MENNLEQLLNILIERGRVPFGEKCKTYEWIFLSKSTRDLVSKESGLWQFVCENGMVNNIYCTWDKYDEDSCPVPNQQHLDKYSEYRLIESSLKDESELEEFLLSNIKVDG